MEAAVIGDRGLEIREVPVPRPKLDEILVKVRACGLNRAEVLMSSGTYRHGNQGGAGADLSGFVETGKISLPIDRTFPLDEAAAAQAHMRANAQFGKIVLTVDH